MRGTAGEATQRKGRDSNPRDDSRRLTVFKTAAFNRSATLPAICADGTRSLGTAGSL
jgi:hypothetical protein